MSFVDQEKRVRPASIAAVALVHVAVGYAIISGLAIRVIHYASPPTFVRDIPIDLPPPPALQQPPRAERTPTTLPPLATNPLVPSQTQSQTIEVGQIPALPSQTETPPLPPLPPAKVSQARGAVTLGNRADWVTTDDYPAAALRQNAEGTTGITVTVGTDGRVSACRVIAPSGNDQLDQAACRTYARRARFQPAIDADGHPIVAEHADRVRWQLPKE